MCDDLESGLILLDDVPQQARSYLALLVVVLHQVRQQVVETDVHALELVFEDQLDFASPVFLVCAHPRRFLPTRFCRSRRWWSG